MMRAMERFKNLLADLFREFWPPAEKQIPPPVIEAPPPPAITVLPVPDEITIARRITLLLDAHDYWAGHGAAEQCDDIVLELRILSRLDPRGLFVPGETVTRLRN